MNHRASSTLPILISGTLLLVLAILWYVDTADATGATGATGRETHSKDAYPEEAVQGSETLDRAEHGTLPIDAPQPPPPPKPYLSGFRGRIVPAEADVDVSILRIDDVALTGQTSSLLKETGSSPSLVAGRTRTDSGGEFLITGVWPGSFYVLRARSADGRATRRIVERTPGPGEIVDLGAIHLNASAEVVGKVTDEHGRPLAGATVRSAPVPSSILRLWPLERFDLRTPLLYVKGDASHVLEIPGWVRERVEEAVVVTTRTDRAGRFRLRGVSHDDTAIFVTSAGRAPEARTDIETSTNAVTDVGTIRLRTGSTLTGRVVDDRNRPIVGAEVLVGQGTTVVPFVFPTRADPTKPDGTFSTAGFREGPCVVAVRRSPNAPWIVREGVVGNELVVKLPGTCDLTLRVRSAPGLALNGLRFKLLSATPDTDDVDLSLLGFKTAIPIEERLIRVDAEHHRLPGLQIGQYVLIVAAKSHSTRIVPFMLVSNRTLAIDLDRQRSFDVLVSDSDGNPLADAQVLLQTESEFPRIPRHPVSCGTTDDQGRLTVTEAMSDRLLVRAKHPTHGSVHRHIELPIEVVHIRLEACGALAGTLSEEGQTPKQGKWMLAVHHTHSSDRIVLPRLSSPNAKGRFRIDGLSPGYYRVSVLRAGAATPLGLALEPSRFAKHFESRSFTSRVPVHPGRTTELDVDAVAGWNQTSGQTASVSGTVTKNGRPATGLEVRGWHKRWLIGRVGSDGRFDLGQVELGDVGIYVVDPRAGKDGKFEMLRWESVSVRGNQPIEVDIDLRLGGLAGRVVDASGHTVTGCLVKLDRRHQDATGKLRYAKFHDVTNRRGEFAFENLPSGTYTATVWDQRRGRVVIPNLVVRDGARITGVALRLRRVVTIGGRVELGAMGSQPPQWAWLRLYGKDSEGRLISKEPGAKIRSDGRFELQGVPPGTYQVSIGGRFRKQGRDLEWETRMFLHETDLVVDTSDLRGITLRPRPAPKKVTRKKPGQPARENERSTRKE